MFIRLAGLVQMNANTMHCILGGAFFSILCDTVMIVMSLCGMAWYQLPTSNLICGHEHLPHKISERYEAHKHVPRIFQTARDVTVHCLGAYVLVARSKQRRW